MKFSRLFVVPVLALVCLAGANTRAAAQINISIGVAPVCPYGYFNYAPYQCAPFGYYGPEWFSGGVFYGAGPWFRGPVGFHGYINHDYDPHFGYRGPFPGRDEHADWGRHRGWEHQWHGNEYHNEVRHDNGNHYGQYKDHGNPHNDGHGNGHNDSHASSHNDSHGHDHDDKDHGHGHDK
jgi:hypothetical protein